MRTRRKSVKMRFITKSLAELAIHWAKPCIAGMGLVLLLTAESIVGRKFSGVKLKDT